MGINEGLILLDDDISDVDQDTDAGENPSTSDAIVALYRIESSIAAQKLQALADTYRAAQQRGDADLEWFTDTLAVEAGSSTAKVSNDLALALQVTESLPKTLALLAAGELDLYRVRKIADATRTLTPEQCAVLEERIYPDVLDTTTGKLVRRVNRVVADLDQDAAEQRRQKSRADRHVWCEPEPHTGMGWLTAYLPGDDLTAIAKRLDTLAVSTNDGVRTMDQRRADTLRDLLLHIPTGALGQSQSPSQSWRGQSWKGRGQSRHQDRDAVSTATDPTGATRSTDHAGATDSTAGTAPSSSTSGATRTASPSGSTEPATRSATRSATEPGSGSANAGQGCGVAATIYVTVSADTLLGLDQHAAELRGYGPITAEHARELAYRLQSEWIGVLIDGTGRAVTMTRNAYRFRGRLAELIRLRDATCTYPGCDRPADRCDIDHVIPWPRGETAPDNASTECRRHHRMKTLTDWTVSRTKESVAWRKPDGRTFTKTIEPITTTSPPHNGAKLAKDDPPPF